MEFAHSEYLLAAWLIPVFLLGYLVHIRFQKKVKQKLGDPGLVEKLMRGYVPIRQHVKFGLLVAAFGCLVLALARPQISGESTVTSPAEGTEIVFAVDVSSSMLASDVLPNRLTRAQSFLNQLVGNFRGEQVGLVVFAGKASPYLPLTSDYATAQSAVKKLAPNLASYQGSSLKEALKIGSLLLQQRSGKPKVLCIVSDGESHQQNFQALADSLRKAGIAIYAVGIGTTTGETIPVKDQAGLWVAKKDKSGQPLVSRLNEIHLKTLTGKKPGNYIYLENNDQAIAALLKGLKNIQRSAPEKKLVKQEFYPHFLLGGFFLLLLELLIPAGNRKHKPTLR